ncbi:MAG: Rab family GTPase [Candidatus Hodarchaeales archaeon]|jgi:small GTP-binding protein
MSIFEVKDDLYKICLVGDGGVGKTAIVERFLGKGFASTYNLTIGTNICTHTVDVDGTRVKFQIWDLAGQQRFEFVRSTFYRGSRAIVMVFDVTNPTSLTNLHEWKIEILQNLGGKRNHNIPIVLLGNKADLQQKLLIDQDAISKFRDALQMEFHADSTAFMYTSALSGMNVEESFEALGLLLLKKKNPQFHIDKTPNNLEAPTNLRPTRLSNA